MTWPEKCEKIGCQFIQQASSLNTTPFKFEDRNITMRRRFISRSMMLEKTRCKILKENLVGMLKMGTPNYISKIKIKMNNESYSQL